MSHDQAIEATPGSYLEVLRVALPLIISMGSFTLMQFCDRIFLAQYSAISIQAALPAGILAFTLSCGFMELAGYANTFVAQYHGAGEPRHCARSTAQAVFLAVLSWPLLLALWPLGCWMLRLAGHEAAVMEQELTYFTILMAGGVVVPLGVACSTFFTGRGDTKTTMMANLVANAVNIALDYALIFGAWGFPQMGIRGAAYATVISGFIGPAILLTLFFSRKLDRVYATRAGFRIDRTLLTRIIRYGFPSAVHLVLDITSFTLFVLFIGRMGPVALAASNMAFSINMLAFMPLIGLGITATTLVGKYQGAVQPEIARRVGWRTLRIGLVYSLLVGLTYLLFPSFYFALFTGEAGAAMPMEDVLPLGRVMLMMMAAWALMDAGNVILSGALKGAGDTRFVMFYSVGMAWGVLVGGLVVIVFVLGEGVLHAWGWLCFYIMLLAIGYSWRFKSGRWEDIDVLGRGTPVTPPRPGPEAVVTAE